MTGIDVVVAAGTAFLASVFLVSATAKVFSLDAFVRDVLLPFTGWSTRSANALAIVVVVAELLVGFALLLPFSRRIASIAALVLLVALTAALLRMPGRGITACRCFGGAGPGHIGPVMVARNVALMLLAGGLASSDVHVPAGWAAVSSLAMVAIGLLLVTGSRSRRDSTRMLLVGERLSAKEARAASPVGGNPTLLLFLSPTCKDCRREAGSLPLVLGMAQRAGVSWRVVIMGRRAAAAQMMSTHGLPAPVVAAAPWRPVVRLLNPRRAAPAFYLIESNEIRAAGRIGGQSWIALSDGWQRTFRENRASLEDLT